MLVTGTRQKAHIHVQARVATSMSPHGPSDQHHPHSPQRRSSYSSICTEWHLLQLPDLNLPRSWRYFAKYQLDHRNQLNLKNW